jgi:hypothetical protein
VRARAQFLSRQQKRKASTGDTFLIFPVAGRRNVVRSQRRGELSLRLPDEDRVLLFVLLSRLLSLPERVLVEELLSRLLSLRLRVVEAGALSRLLSLRERVVSCVFPLWGLLAAGVLRVSLPEEVRVPVLFDRLSERVLVLLERVLVLPERLLPAALRVDSCRLPALETVRLCSRLIRSLSSREDSLK